MCKQLRLAAICLMTTFFAVGCATTPESTKPESTKPESTISTLATVDRVFEYALVFDGFTADEMLQMENRVMAFAGYRSHRPVYQGYRKSELWYQSSEPAPDVHRQLTAALTDMGIANLVRLDSEQILVRKINKRKPKPAPSGPSNDDW